MPASRFSLSRLFSPAILLFAGALLGFSGVTFAQKTGELKPVETVDLGSGVTMEFVLIIPGSFTMGSDQHDMDEKPVHTVVLTQPYYMGRCEVTQEQWTLLMNDNPSHFKGSQLPVENVSWHDCQAFLAALHKKTGRRFTLPTEAQWEYACRAGTATEYGFGDDIATLDDHAWHASNSGLKTHPVGQKKPNAWGLYDMHGNVYEWCADWYSEGPYAANGEIDPQGPRSGYRRVLRGGAWLYVPPNLRSRDRGFSPPDYRSNEYGFRCVLLPDNGPSQNEADAAVLPTSLAAPATSLVEQIQDLINQGDRLAAEFLLAESGAKITNPSALQQAINQLPTPPERLTIDLGDRIPMEFMLIRPGSFTMGSDPSPIDNEKPAHRVTITRPFYLGKCEVTQAQWTAVIRRNPSAFVDEETSAAHSALPVENVSWTLCESFLAKLNEKIPGRGFRLPTEAEWEYACRAGTTGPHHFSEGTLGDYAWCGANSGNRTHPVGQKKPNAWGLHDMYGNVWEWCADRFGLYSAEPSIDPTGPAVSGFAGARVLRGGAWNNIETHVNSTFRHDAGPNIPLRYYGFRCAFPAVPAREGRPR